MAQNTEENWTTVIKPRNKLFEVNLKEIWDYRDLLMLFVKRTITVQYKQTILGPLWWVIQPAMTVIMYMIVFGGIAGIPTDGIPQPLFYLGGVAMWQYFSDCLTKASNTFVTNAGIFGKVYFPRLIIPLASMTSHLFKMAIQLVLFVAVYIYFVAHGAAIRPNWTLLLFPVYLLILALTGMSWGLFVTALTTKYRDLRMFTSFVFGLLMYATPVIYPMSVVKDSIYGAFLRYNPVAPFFEAFRYGATGIGLMDWGWMAYGVGCMLVTLFFGVLVFNKVEKNFIDTV